MHGGDFLFYQLDTNINQIDFFFFLVVVLTIMSFKISIALLHAQVLHL